MVLGTLVSLRSPYWILIWAGIEVSLIGLIPLILSDGRYLRKEGTVKYFTVQAIGSILILFGSLLRFFPRLSWERLLFESSLIGRFLIILGILVKLGVFPFYAWVPRVITSLNWNRCLLVLTWQKIAPLSFIAYLVQNFNCSFLGIIILFSAVRSLIGAVGGLSQSIIRAILGYSSITHTGWIVFGRFIGIGEVIIYFLIYRILTLSLFLSLKSLEAYTPRHSFSMKSLVVINLFSLRGIPPFLGFCGKWVILRGAIALGLAPLFIFFLVSGSVVRLYFYTKLIYSFVLVEYKTENQFKFTVPVVFGSLNIIRFLLFLAF